MRKGNVHQLAIGKHALDLATKAFVQAVVVIRVQEAAAHQVLTQPQDLGVGELDVAVARHVDEWIVPEFVVHQRDASLRPFHGQRSALAYGGQEVGQARRIRVPVAATVVLETGHGKPW